MDYNESLYNSLLPLIIISECMTILFSYFALTWGKRKSSEETLSRLHASFIGIFLIEFWYWLTTPFIAFFKLVRLTPNGVTATSVILSFITGIIYSTGSIAFAGWMLVISGTLDMLDGRLARETGTSTKAGAFFDSCSDRYSDTFVFIGIGIYFLSKNYSASEGHFIVSLIDYSTLIVVLFLMLGTASMSYVKARGEATGVTTKSGLMQRTERVMMLSLYSVLDPFIRVILERYRLNQDYCLILLLIIMAILINISAIMRMADIFKLIRNSER